MDDDDLDARVAARQDKKKKKKGEPGGDGAPRKKKKKKKKPDDGSGDKKRRPKLDADAEAKASARDVMAACAVARDDPGKRKTDDFDAKSAYAMGNGDDDGFGGGDVEKDRSAAEMEKSDRSAAELEKSGQGLDYDAAVVDAGVADSAYYFEADAEAMAEIGQDGLVQVDEAGGIQAFVAETIAIDGDAVGIIKSDAEVEQEEKRRYSKYFILAVSGLVVLIAALAVPLTLKFAKGRQVTREIKITAPPTDAPSLLPSAAPSAMPSSIRFIEIVKKLQPLSGEALYQRGSPQYLAAMWMADRDPLRNFKTGGTGLDLDDARFEQRYVMALFYYAMDGPNWYEDAGWLGDESECEWLGIKGTTQGCPTGCIKRSDFMGDFDKVCRLSLPRHSNLYGQLPSELGILTEMRWFEIQDSYLVGTIPRSYGTGWTKLHTMLLGSNYLSGGFPDTFEDNHLLGTIFIDHNMFNGTFPNAFATLKNLEWLDTENNKFRGTLPEGMSDLKSLRILNVNNNTLTGYLPTTWDDDNLIEDLEFANNQLKGNLPPSLGNAKFLKDLRASNNKFTGGFPVEYYKFQYLEELYLDMNLLGGELPQTAEPFWDGLQELSLHSNDFEGNFPIQHMEDTLRIKVLELHRNRLTGQISAGICARKDASRAYTQLEMLSVDCDKIECDCCTCYMGGELVEGAGR